MKFIAARSCNPDKVQLNTLSVVNNGDSQTEITAIVKVAEAGYVPSGIDVRAQLAPNLFTAKMHRADIARLDQDPRVLSIDTGRRLQIIK